MVGIWSVYGHLFYLYKIGDHIPTIYRPYADHIITCKLSVPENVSSNFPVFLYIYISSTVLWFMHNVRSDDDDYDDYVIIFLLETFRVFFWRIMMMMISLFLNHKARKSCPAFIIIIIWNERKPSRISDDHQQK